MNLRLACALSLVLFGLTPAAAAADGPTYLMSGWTGVTAPGASLRFVALPAGSQTVLASVSRSSGRVIQWRSFRGTWGIPMVANDGTTAGLSRDGRLLVLGDWSAPRTNGLRPASRFLVLNTRTFGVWRRISLRGDFSFDALSPGGRTLYLIQHLTSPDTSSYRVRAFDVAGLRLLSRVIADRRQSTWIMSGSPVTRATSSDRRWAYTLYQNAGGFPFVHALDTVARTAICVGIPWRRNQDILPFTKLVLDEHAGKLTLTTRRGRPLFDVNTKTFWVSRPAHHGGAFWGFLRL
jgi:hypothetical protein